MKDTEKLKKLIQNSDSLNSFCKKFLAKKVYAVSKSEASNELEIVLNELDYYEREDKLKN